MKLYAKENISEAVSGMLKKDCLSHGFLLTGSVGSGRKTAAKLIASHILCEHSDDPCLSGNEFDESRLCRHCKRIMNGTHPDVIYPERSGKSMLYAKETLQNVAADAYVMPNDCDKKLYIFSDSEKIAKENQGVLLKIIEEPPEHCCFIFTAQSREALLPTMISRLICMSVACPSEEECFAELTASGFAENDVMAAVDAFHGNIGMCRSFIETAEIRENTAAASDFSLALTCSDEYGMLKALASVGENRERLRSVILLCVDILRDGLALRTGGGCLSGCCKQASEKIASLFSYQKITAAHDCFRSTLEYLDANANVPAAAAALTAELVSVK